MEDKLRTLRGSVCAVFCFLAGLSPASASTIDCLANPTNQLNNCGFETGDFTSWALSGHDVPLEQGNLYGVEGTDPFPLPGGTAPNSGNFQAFFADQFADPTTLSQTIATAPGSTYTISFSLAQFLVGPGAVKNSAVVTFDGVTLLNLTNIAEQPYTLYTFSALANSSSTALSFEFGNDIGEFLLDDVSVATAAPEPSSGALLLIGGLLLGWIGHRKTALARK